MRQILFLCIVFVSFCFSLEVQKPKVYTQDTNITGWVMSEKLDGIRGYWSGKELLTKNGNPIVVPKWFIKNFLPFELDGELWSKRDDFEFIQSTVLDGTPSQNWQKITYNIFEVPHAKGDFLGRLVKTKKWFENHPNNFMNIIEQIPCKDEEHLQSFLEEIIDLKGEGVIVKDPTQEYHTGRSPHILKVKKALDMEGLIIAHNLRADGTLKSLQIKLHNGVVFNLGGGFSKNQRKSPPSIGKIVTFKYYGLTKKGKPKFASYLRVRELE